MKVCLNKKETKEQFPIEIVTNIGIQYYTLRAAKELQARLETIIKVVEKDVP
jgi:hypothetical protein